MRKIINPFLNSESYRCFGCSPNNENGLQMEFFEDGDELVSFWEPKEFLQGWGTILHGGIQATLMDEIASWAIFIKLETAGVTTKIETYYKRPVLLDKNKLMIRAKVKGVIEGVANIHVRLFDSKEHLCTEGSIFYKVFTKEKARTKLNYPGIEKFFNE